MLVWINHTGHWLIEEKPEQIRQHILNFLDKRATGEIDVVAMTECNQCFDRLCISKNKEANHEQ